MTASGRGSKGYQPLRPTIGAGLSCFNGCLEHSSVNWPALAKTTHHRQTGSQLLKSGVIAQNPCRKHLSEMAIFLTTTFATRIAELIQCRKAARFRGLGKKRKPLWLGRGAMLAVSHKSSPRSPRQSNEVRKASSTADLLSLFVQKFLFLMFRDVKVLGVSTH